MAASNVEIVRRMYDAFHGGDFEGALAHYHPEVEVGATSSVDGGPGRGREALAAMIGRWVSAFDDWSEEIEEMREVGGAVLVVALQRGRGRDTGIELETRYALLYWVRDGLIARITLYRDRDEALAAAA
jgi:ketosteroid isomerase-like protein